MPDEMVDILIRIYDDNSKKEKNDDCNVFIVSN